MENNEKKIERLDNVKAEDISGGTRNLNKVICCTCGAEIQLTVPMMGQYYNNNVCPRCHGRLKSW